jgi:hypothetical protein
METVQGDGAGLWHGKNNERRVGWTNEGGGDGSLGTCILGG